jgi:hypothetical protein
MAEVDQMAPALPKPMVARITRHDGTGCMGGDSCGDFTAVNLTNLATDDQTPSDRIGYRFALVAGALPSGFALPTGVVDLAMSDASLWLDWPGIDSDFDFTLQLVAVDRAGNESAPQTVRISEDTGGCSIGHPRGTGAVVIAAAVFVLASGAWRSRRRKTEGQRRPPEILVATAIAFPTPIARRGRTASARRATPALAFTAGCRLAGTGRVEASATARLASSARAAAALHPRAGDRGSAR